MIISADQVIESALLQCNKDIREEFDNAEVLFLKASMTQPVDDNLRLEIERLCADKKEESPRNRLIVLIETNGGYIEVVERIVTLFRKHYEFVEFVVPNYSYSAGTVLAMSGDEIHMDYHSILGPIDPQFESENGDYVPGMGYLAKYEELVEKINKAENINSVRAETAYLVQKFDPAKLYHIEQAIEHSKSLLKSWLPKYKFKDWNYTETNKTPVTNDMKEARAAEIADVLGKADRWHSHGRGITFKELQSEDIKLIVKDFGEKDNLSNKIRTYYSLIIDYLGKMGWAGAIHSHNGLRKAR